MACRLLLLPRFLKNHRFPWLRRSLSGTVGDVELFDKILVANRGEIACRVMRTARQLGVRTVGVYSEADCNAMHVAMADEAYCIGPPPSSESYLRQDRIMEVARATGAQAIHPGYGFLSENKNFAELCKSEGVEFVGPPALAIEKMGAKRLSKSIMSSSSVPVVPGYFGDDQSDERLLQESNEIGYPVMLKADLGGGGKGMRIVWSEAEFPQALQACRSEATKSFGDDKVLVEKFVDRPRHIEVQVFADKHGNTVHLFERDCSVQRRHQKIIEEAPAPHLRADAREKICAAAVRAAEAVGYVGAGTVEFIMDPRQEFYFMEMNTRLQVEHPITEMITGTDLVEWQLRVAAGGTLPLTQEQIRENGHAFEARIYAENPEMGFIPSPGHLKHLAPPPTMPTVRVDTGVQQGDHVTTFYDPMIAKLVVWGQDRSSALKKLHDNLSQYQVAGVSTNIGFLERLAESKGFQSGDVHTGFIEQHEEELFPTPPGLSEEEQMLSALTILSLESLNSSASHSYSHDPYSPFSEDSGGRVNTGLVRRLHFTSPDNDTEFTVNASYRGQGQYLLSVKEGGGMSAVGQLEWEGQGGGARQSLKLRGTIGDRQVLADVAVVEDTIHIFTRDSRFQVSLPKPSFQQLKEELDDSGVRSPKYPSTVTKVYVTVGQEVNKGDVLATVEGMKMETNILAAKKGTVKSVLFQERDSVPAFSTVIELQEC